MATSNPDLSLIEWSGLDKIGGVVGGRATVARLDDGSLIITMPAAEGFNVDVRIGRDHEGRRIVWGLAIYSTRLRGADGTKPGGEFYGPPRSLPSRGLGTADLRHGFIREALSHARGIDET